MKRILFALLALAMWAVPTLAGGPGGRAPLHMFKHYNRAARWYNANVPWHGPYAHHTWRQPVALAVPAVANMQTNYSWGVARTRVAPNYHQFTRPYVPSSGGGSPPVLASISDSSGVMQVQFQQLGFPSGQDGVRLIQFEEDPVPRSAQRMSISDTAHSGVNPVRAN